MTKFIALTIPKFTYLTMSIKNPFLLLAPITLVPVVPLNGVAELLMWLFVIDLCTGIVASYFIWKATAPKGKYFFRASDALVAPNAEVAKGFSSDRFKKCFVKGIVYGGFPLVVWKFQTTFLIKNFKMPSYISDSEVELTAIILLIFCANELFSIFWENLPKCGINLPKGIRNLITGVKEIKDESKSE